MSERGPVGALFGDNVETIYDYFYGDKQKKDKMSNLMNSLKSIQADTQTPPSNGFSSGAQMSAGIEPTGSSEGFDPLELFSRKNRDVKSQVLQKVIESGYMPTDKSIEPILKMFDNDWQQDPRAKQYVNEDLYNRKGEYLQDNFDLKGDQSMLENKLDLGLEDRKNQNKLSQIDRSGAMRKALEVLRGKNRSTKHGGVTANDFYSGRFEPDEVDPEIIDLELEDTEDQIADLESEKPDKTDDYWIAHPEEYKARLAEYKRLTGALRKQKAVLRYTKREQLRRGKGENPIKEEMGPKTEDRSLHDQKYQQAQQVITKGPKHPHYKSAVDYIQRYRNTYGKHKLK